MKKDKFFNRLEPWSERKHRLLGKYIKPFSAKVASMIQDREIYCVDGFAGAAKYDDNKAGSPLMIAHLSDECRKWQNPVNLKIINVEFMPRNFDSLEYLTQQWIEKGIVRNINAEFHKTISEILSIIQQTPSLFFIDPFGPTDFYFSHLLPILKRSQPITELVLNFDTDGLQRIADTIKSKTNDSKTLKAIQTNIENVSKILGSENWLEKYQNSDLTTQQRQNLLLSIYIENLKRFGYSVVAYPIREGMNTPTKYHLIFCTRHNDGIILMNDFIYEEENTLEQESLPLLASSLGNEIENNRKRLYSLIEGYLETNSKTTRRQIKRHFIFEYFAQFHNEGLQRSSKRVYRF